MLQLPGKVNLDNDVWEQVTKALPAIAGVGLIGASLAAIPTVISFARRCCRTLTVEDSHRESVWLDRANEQAIPRPVPHDELVQLLSVAAQARVAADLAGQGHDLARAV